MASLKLKFNPSETESEPRELIRVLIFDSLGEKIAITMQIVTEHLLLWLNNNAIIIEVYIIRDMLLLIVIVANSIMFPPFFLYSLGLILVFFKGKAI